MMAAAAAARLRFILPGELAAGCAPGGAATILGSCVAVALWDGNTGCGGLNHYMLAEAPADAAGNPKFGSVSLPRLLARVLACGAKPRALVAKIFGGGAVLDSITDSRIGDANVALARAFLAREGIPVTGECVGNRHGLKLQFDYGSGTVRVRGIQRREYAEETEQTVRRFHRKRHGGVLVIAADERVRAHLTQWLLLRGGTQAATVAENMFVARTELLRGRFAAMVIDAATPHLDLAQLLAYCRRKHPDSVLAVLGDGSAPAGTLAVARDGVLGTEYPAFLELHLGTGL